MKGWRTVVGVALSCMLGAGCATTGSGTTVTGAGDERVCIKVSTINSFSVIDEQHVYVDATGKDAFLLTLENLCSGLKFARGIAIANAMSRVCGDGSGILVYDNSPTGKKRCRIVRIDRVADKVAAEALVADRRNAELKE